jgi:hypothetical protein
MSQYEDMPEELGDLFPVEDIAIPPIIRAVITDGWDIMDSSQQRSLIEKLRVAKEPIPRALIAVFEASKVLLAQPPEDIVY